MVLMTFPGPATAQVDPELLGGVSIPADFPKMVVRHSDDPSPGYFFLNNWGRQPYNVIFDNAGNPVWYLRTPDRRRDFKLQPDGRLTMLTRWGYHNGEAFIAMDDRFAVVDTLYAVDGYRTDEHELTVLADGSYYLIGRDETQEDLSDLGGQTSATVRETVIQGFTPSGVLNFEWRAWDHFDIADIQLDGIDGSYIRFPHMNAIAIDDDGDVLVSSRHLSEVTKIDRQTGEIVWRLGGAHNQFTWVNDPLEGFYNQHDIRALGGGRYTIFDNGNGHPWPQETRVLEYQIDPDAMTATLVWEYRSQPPVYTHWMGNAQRLPGGNTMINYADQSLPKITEVRPDGSLALEMDWEIPQHTYRAFKFDWMGRADRPYLLAEPGSHAVTLLFNTFGEPDLVEYRVYGDVGSSTPTTLLTTTEQPFAHLTELPGPETYSFCVTSVTTDGAESPCSNVETFLVNLVDPGTNLLLNGAFDGSRANWDFEVTGSASARIVARDEMVFEIDEGGTEWWNVQLRQGGLPLRFGATYVFEFDAWASSPRFIEAKVTRDASPWTNYGRIGLSALTSERQHFSYEFVMNDPSDPAARVVINTGLFDPDVFIDDIILREVVTGTWAERPQAPRLAAGTVHPNPSSGDAALEVQLDQPGSVRLRVVDLLGRRIREATIGGLSAGRQRLSLPVRDLAAGMYLCHLEFHSSAGTSVIVSRPFVRLGSP